MAENETPYEAGFRAGQEDTRRKWHVTKWRDSDERICALLLAFDAGGAVEKLAEAATALQTRIIAHPSVPRCYRGNAASDAWDDSAAEIRTSDEWDRLVVALAALRALLPAKGGPR